MIEANGKFPGSPSFDQEKQSPSNSPLPSKTWKTGFFQCHKDCCTFLKALVCPCIVYGKNMLKFHGTGDLVQYCCAYIQNCYCLFGCKFRQNLEKKYRIEGDELLDLCAHTFCCSCALAQENREMNLRGGDYIVPIE